MKDMNRNRNKRQKKGCSWAPSRHIFHIRGSATEIFSTFFLPTAVQTWKHKSKTIKWRNEAVPEGSWFFWESQLVAEKKSDTFICFISLLSSSFIAFFAFLLNRIFSKIEKYYLISCREDVTLYYSYLGLSIS